ncbi:50S ribosomal protein L31e [Fervidicoccus fontis]|uniref:Large ribosomal subunit protein eL31 n=2 Tax=Fervidicoccus fontis TaxID=683846 RepID=I0A2P0_FERFK|nr:50S ribosomal protein L31e [Fervidicoccus fontis]AFH43247.1 hypothetical protein FFONT_1259 [Fervidicoccus fontis Kam940]MBE9390627.1 50S ribosomal protein L31e [Fervidicoccus fontis]PMB75779.1 MAG: 50S ribosomal protein L31e [Fervidicoccus fontis]PMB76498.1 MAG: 50S ribosomal protein L31e [Fervidicoccus fontis]HEW63455.1 50S ribosomal protein L31e [Fervidicoccus fontis]
MKGNELEEVINLRKVYSSRKTSRAARAIRYIKDYIRRRFHTEEIKIDDSVNKLIWSRGIEKPPRKLRVKIIAEEMKEIKTKSGEVRKHPTKVKVELPKVEKVENKNKKEKGKEE